MKPILTICICSLPQRLKRFSLIEELSRQAKGKPVEILYLGDNQSMTVGKKRSILACNLARGERVAFCDDDDRVSPGYVDKLLQAHKEHPNVSVICFRAEVTMKDSKGNKSKPKICLYSIKFKDRGDSRYYYRSPNHLMAWKRDLIKPYEHKNFGEDAEWAARMKKQHGLTEHVLNDVLYYYDFDETVTETRG